MKQPIRLLIVFVALVNFGICIWNHEVTETIAWFVAFAGWTSSMYLLNERRGIADQIVNESLHRSDKLISILHRIRNVVEKDTIPSHPKEEGQKSDPNLPGLFAGHKQYLKKY